MTETETPNPASIFGIEPLTSTFCPRLGSPRKFEARRAHLRATRAERRAFLERLLASTGRVQAMRIYAACAARDATTAAETKGTGGVEA